MKTVLAYVLVIPLVQFAFTLGVLFGSFGGILLSWLPEKYGVQVRSFVSGCVGGITSVSYGFVVFRLLVGEGSFSTGPFLATVLPLSMPILNDYCRYQKVKRHAIDEPGNQTYAGQLISRMINGTLKVVLGELAGILIGGCLFMS